MFPGRLVLPGWLVLKGWFMAPSLTGGGRGPG